MSKILFLTSRFPFPLTKGDKLRVFYQIKYLSATHDIYLIAIDDHSIPQDHVEELRPYCKGIYVLNIPLYKRIFSLIVSPFIHLPLQVAFFYNPEVHKKIDQLIDQVKPDFIHCHLIRTTEYARHQAKYRRSLDFMDAFGKGMERREKNEHNPFKRMFFSFEKRMLYSYEKRVFDFIDKFCIISAQDRQSIPSARSGQISIVPNGVDLDQFYPREENKTYDILFMGNMAYPPNIKAVLFLTNEILPLIRKVKPEIKLLIAGIDPPGNIRQLQSMNIDVIENFDHISDSIAISRIMIAPMLISIGLQNKILQAMAMKVPCIVSKLANNAIGAKNKIEIIEADKPGDFADSVIELLSDEKKASELANNAIQFIRQNYSWEKQNDLFKQLFE